MNDDCEPADVIRQSSFVNRGTAVIVTVFHCKRVPVGLMMAPSLSAHLTHLRWPRRLPSWIPATAGLAILIGAGQAECASYLYRFGAQVHPGLFPVDAVRFIRDSGLSGNMFNSYRFGGYLIWSLWPGQRVFVDGREDVYVSAGVLNEYLQAFASSTNWKQLTTKYAIDYAMVQYPETAATNARSSVESSAFPRSEWALVYFDDLAAIYARRNGQNDSVIRQAEIHTVQPFQMSSYLDAVVADPYTLRRFVAEMQDNLRSRPGSFRAHFTLGILHVKRGSLAEAMGEFQRAAELNPEFAPAFLNLGSIYRHFGRLAEARQAFTRCLALEDSPLAQRQINELERIGR